MGDVKNDTYRAVHTSPVASLFDIPCSYPHVLCGLSLYFLIITGVLIKGHTHLLVFTCVLLQATRHSR